MSATNNREVVIANSQFGGGAAPTGVAPSNWFLGLSTTTPADDGTGFTEPSTGGYARVTIINDGTRWVNPAVTGSDGITRKTNLVAFTFPNPTGSWGQLTHWGLFTASTGGTPEWIGELDAPISPRNGNSPVEFAAGQFVLIWD